MVHMNNKHVSCEALSHERQTCLLLMVIPSPGCSHIPAVHVTKDFHSTVDQTLVAECKMVKARLNRTVMSFLLEQARVTGSQTFPWHHLRCNTASEKDAPSQHQPMQANRHNKDPDIDRFHHPRSARMNQHALMQRKNQS